MKRCFLVVAVALASAPAPAAAQLTSGSTLQAPGASSLGAAPFAGAGAKVAATQADRATESSRYYQALKDHHCSAGRGSLQSSVHKWK